jgi:Tfp pilus assembly protein PilN
MTELTLTPNVPGTNENDEAAIEQCWAELQRLRKQIDADQAEIDRLKAETQAMLASLKVMAEAR